jgi:cysteine desulfurase
MSTLWASICSRSRRIKCTGPKRIGALYVRSANPRVKVMPLIDGGGHERGMRSGTPQCRRDCCLGAACEIARKEMASEGERMIAFARTFAPREL